MFVPPTHFLNSERRIARLVTLPENKAGKHQLPIIPFKRSLPMPRSLNRRWSRAHLAQAWTRKKPPLIPASIFEACPVCGITGAQIGQFNGACLKWDYELPERQKPRRKQAGSFRTAGRPDGQGSKCAA